MEAMHPGDERWDAQAMRWRHPIARTTISVIEPADSAESPKPPPNAAFGFGREMKAQPLDADDVWEGMGL